MIPARIGSQRLARKNLQPLGGVPLLARAIRRCQAAGVFDAIWVNGDHDAFADMARAAGVHFHRRPPDLAGHAATSEDYLGEFLAAHPCDALFQVHSIAPLFGADLLRAFVTRFDRGDCDVLISCVAEQIECLHAGRPVNFDFARKENSQDLTPVERLTWAVTAWRRATFLAARSSGACATYAGRVATFPTDRIAGHIIKTADDLRVAEALLPLCNV